MRNATLKIPFCSNLFTDCGRLLTLKDRVLHTDSGELKIKLFCYTVLRLLLAKSGQNRHYILPVLPPSTGIDVPLT